MRKLFFLIALQLFILPINSQPDNLLCGTVESTDPDPVGVLSGQTDLTQLTETEIKPVFFRVFIWGVNRPNGNNDYPNRAYDALTAIANLNKLYNQFNIFFKFAGYEEFNSPYTDPNDPSSDPHGFYVLETPSEFNQLKNWAIANGYNKSDAFNVYAYGWGIGFGGIAEQPGLNSGVRSSGLSGTTLVHEIGHNLGIRHTRSSSENATRDPNDPNFNATTAGDRVVDTAANSGFRDNSCACYPFIDQLNCTYIGFELDPEGEPYEIFHEDVINAMSDAYPCSTTHQYLSDGQGIRAREFLTMSIFDGARATIEEIYEPYQGEYFLDGPEPTPADAPLFQPGFDYYFYECCCDYPQPSEYTDISFSYSVNDIFSSFGKDESNYDLIIHPNHSAIYIKHILNGVEYFGQPRKCYDNWNLPPKDGSVTKFNDGVFNTNVTITPKDSIGINNPNLILNLEPGLYKIEKNYNDGSINETIIVKSNN